MNSRPGPNKLTTGDGPAGPPLPLAVDELSERCMGNAVVATLLLDKFEKQLHGDIREIEQRLAARDAGQIARTAHALKGAAGAVAAPLLRDLAAEVETLARAENLESIARKLSSLRTEVERCLGHLPVARGVLATAARQGPLGTGSAS